MPQKCSSGRPKSEISLTGPSPCLSGRTPPGTPGRISSCLSASGGCPQPLTCGCITPFSHPTLTWLPHLPASDFPVSLRIEVHVFVTPKSVLPLGSTGIIQDKLTIGRSFTQSHLQSPFFLFYHTK